MSSDNIDEDEDSEIPVDLASLQAELSPATLAALLSFLPNRAFEDDEQDSSSITSKNISDGAVCVAYTAKDVNTIAETFKRLATKNEENELKIQRAAEQRVLYPLLHSFGDCILPDLLENGVVRINSLLPVEICDRLLAEINLKLVEEIANCNPMTRETGFGNVLCREHRWDLYLRNEGNYPKYYVSTVTLYEHNRSVLLSSSNTMPRGIQRGTD